MSTEWSPPGWKITEGYPEAESGFRSVSYKCLAEGCGHTSYTGLPKSGISPDRVPFLVDHQDQHRPDRALNIEVDWIVSACCSVCEDEIGDVVEDSDGLVCNECGTYWSRDGTGGYRDDE